MRRIVRFLLAVLTVIATAVAVNASPLGIAVWDLLRLIGIVSYAECNDTVGVYTDPAASASCITPTSMLVVSLTTTALTSLGAGVLIYFLAGRVQRHKGITHSGAMPRG